MRPTSIFLFSNRVPSLQSGVILTFLWIWSSTATPFFHKIDQAGAVASESSICSNIGIELLKRGGNAADALVGTTLCVGTIGMYHSGIGGGGFMLVRDAQGHYESIDFRETAPAAAFEDMYKHNVNASMESGLASGVPGELRGLEYLHRKYGVLPWRVICEPAVQVARDGFPVSEDFLRYIDPPEDNEFLVADPEWAKDFAPNGTLLGMGDIITRKRYANTLETIAREGADAFYEGDIAKATIRALQAANGTMTLDDLKNYQIVTREAIQIDYRGYRLFSTSAPSSGAVALSTLKTIEGYAMSNPEILPLNTHRLVEAMKFAYAAHNELGDPAFFDDMETFQSKMLNASTSLEIRHKISDYHTKDVSSYDPKNLTSPDTHGTSHVVTADASGMAISMTTTINLLFGSKLMVPETGIIMNNEMNDFSIPNVTNAFGFVPCPTNFIRPGKRPLSSITPVIVERPDGSLYIAVGSAGGSRIPTATIQALWHVLDHGLTMPEALAEPRLHHQLIPNVAKFEHTFDNATVEQLRKRGHEIEWFGYSSSVQGLRLLSNGTFEVASEPRQNNSGGFAY